MTDVIQSAEVVGLYQIIVDEVAIDLDPGLDTLITLDVAAEMEMLGGQYTARQLRDYARRDDIPFPAVKPGREYKTCARWVAEWLEEMRTCRARPRRRDYTGTPSEGLGASSTSGSEPVSGSLTARLALLKSGSPSTSST